MSENEKQDETPAEDLKEGEVGTGDKLQDGAVEESENQELAD